MYNTRKITEDLIWIGSNDRRLALFENVYPIPNGISYNSYILENLEYELGERELDYIIVNHMEPDHAAVLQIIVDKYPNAKIICNAKTVSMIKQFFNFNVEERAQVVKEGDILNTGRHTLTFVMAPMVHWPEVMVTYDTTDKILFSADAFGTFGALSGSLFADEFNFEEEWLGDARRYYTNIVGKYGT